MNLFFILYSSDPIQWGKLLPRLKSSSLVRSLLPRSFATASYSSPAWSRSRSKKESDSSSIEDSGQAYVEGKVAGLCRIVLFTGEALALCRIPNWNIYINIYLCFYKSILSNGSSGRGSRAVNFTSQFTSSGSLHLFAMQIRRFQKILSQMLLTCYCFYYCTVAVTVADLDSLSRKPENHNFVM